MTTELHKEEEEEHTPDFSRATRWYGKTSARSETSPVRYPRSMEFCRTTLSSVLRNQGFDAA